MPKWIVVTEVESEVDPAVFNYVNGTTLISSQLKEEDSEKAKPFTFCDGCGFGLSYKKWRYIPSGGTFLCDNCSEERVEQ
jgi:hypothetical protein